MTAAQTTETQIVGLVRNALLIAGQEMGDTGDHWPIVNATINSIMKDWEQIQIEQNVQAELKANFINTIAELRDIQKHSPEEFKPRVEEAIRQLEEIYAAAFSDFDESKSTINAENVPPYIHRAEAIIKTLEDDND